jgi:hypothetical protein
MIGNDLGLHEADLFMGFYLLFHRVRLQQRLNSCKYQIKYNKTFKIPSTLFHNFLILPVSNHSTKIFSRNCNE